MSLASGTRLGPYEILAPLGAGGMGEVYRARDTRLGREVAIKVLPASLASDTDRRARFEREAKTVSALSHPHICAVYDVGAQDGVDFLVMEYLEGQSLAQRLEGRVLPLADVLRIGLQIADALDKAHRHGVVHRDLKPANVMLTKSGAKLLDFGLAKARPAVAPAGAESQLPTGEKPLTAEGTLLGTFQYMAPEQLEGREADARADIWALGCVLYEMATGRRPFTGKSQATLIGAILRDEPPPPSSLKPLTPPALDRVIRACLAKDPDERWQSAHDVMSELRWIAEEQGVPPSDGRRRAGVSRRAWLGAALLAAIALTVGTWKLMVARGAGARQTPVIILMDSQHPLRVYDAETRKSGGTNADDLADLLRDLPVALVKENTGPSWHRENDVLRADPALILVHRSCFYVPWDESTTVDLSEREREFYERSAGEKLNLFIAYVGLANPRTRFLVYSRRGFRDPADRDRWQAGIENRFPALKGRVFPWMVPLDRANFRHPTTAAEIKGQVRALLDLKP